MDDPEQQMTRKPDDKEPLAGLAFKIMADQFQVLPPPPSFAFIIPVEPGSSLVLEHVKQQAVLKLQVVAQGPTLLSPHYSTNCHANCVTVNPPICCVVVIQQHNIITRCVWCISLLPFWMLLSAACQRLILPVD